MVKRTPSYIIFYLEDLKGEDQKKDVFNIPTSKNSDVVDHYAIKSMIRKSTNELPIENENKLFNTNRLDIHWVIPDFNIGSGGHMTLLRMVNYLEYFGHKCTIWIVDPIQHSDAESAYEDIVKHFKPVLASVHLVDEFGIQSKGDAIIATGWQTAFEVEHALGFKAKYYFVQDHEVEFYATGANSLACRETYKLDLGCICASPWLEHLMQNNYNRWACSFHLSHEPKEYFREENWKSNLLKTKPRIAVYARNTTERRAVKLVLAALQIMAEEGIDFSVDFFGQQQVIFKQVPFEARDHGVLSSTELSNLYRQCQIGICFSATNYSLVPQEMMACMLPVMELDTVSTRAIFPEGVVSFCGPHPKKIAEELANIIVNPHLRVTQALTAYDWVSQFSWAKSAKEVELGIIDFLEYKKYKNQDTIVKKVGVDVVIPTYNGGELLKKVIAEIRNQESKYDIKIYCVDSSSSDGTNEWLQSQEDIILETIDKSQFQHGKTRNLGASLGSGEFIVFITQDALPAHKYWIHHLVGMLERYENSAGVFGRHLPYESHSSFTKYEIEKHFEKFDQGPVALSKNVDLAELGFNEDRASQFLHFYSDNNSGMRRSVWEIHPYPNVDYGEDQIWAKLIIEKGYEKIYAQHGTVYHSHDFNPKEIFNRCKIESQFFKQNFGYSLGPEEEKDVSDQLHRLNEHSKKLAKKLKIKDSELKNELILNEMKIKGWLAGNNL